MANKNPNLGHLLIGCGLGLRRLQATGRGQHLVQIMNLVADEQEDEFARLAELAPLDRLESTFGGDTAEETLVRLSEQIRRELTVNWASN